jgi:DNA-binding LacI/PurR family transcriptional regulator
MKAAKEFGLTAGVDYAIMGFDDAEESRSLSMTSMRPPFERMGAEAVKLLRMGLAGEQADQQICLRAELITRPTTAIREDRAPSLR